MRFATTFLLLLIVANHFQSGVAEEKKEKNVILIMADDSAADNYGSYGSNFFQTPHLDKLAAQGARFTHCYSGPVCTTSRVKIMTGRCGIRNYSMFGSLDKNEVTFGSMMKNAGYATAIAGKWQLHGPPNGSLAPECGFDTYCLWNYPGTERARFWNASIMQDGELLETTEEDYGPDIFTDYIIDFIEEKKDEPFFVYYPMVLTHSPFVATPDSEPIGELKGKEKSLRYFQDMTAYADKCVGRIVDALEERGLSENTVVIYTTDNGTDRSLSYPFGDETRNGMKAWAIDAGTHAPLLVSCPGTIPEGTQSDDLVDFSDFLPTIADIAGAEMPDVKLDGRSFWPQCQGKEGDPRKWIYQYYYPKFTEAGKPHGEGINGNEIAWAQNQNFKLYRDGTMYAVSDRDEKNPIVKNGAGERGETARAMLQKAIDSMPDWAAKLAYEDKGEKGKKDLKKKDKSHK